MAAATVRFPTAHLYADLGQAPFVGERSPARLNSLTRFLYECEVRYYESLSGHLRGLGLRCPITGTNQDFSDAGNAANASCEAMTRNNYWCHPDVHAEPYMRFRNLAMVASEVAGAATPVANVASSTVEGKPMVVPEFNFPWPNEWRAECLPLMAAYACLQDWDGLLFFAYDPNRDQLSSFGNASDPVRWGQVPLAALIFHRGDVAAARTTVHVGVSAADRFATRRRRTGDTYSHYRVLPYISRLRNVYFDDRYAGSADIAFASGHSAAGDYSQAAHAIVFADSAHVDELGARSDRGLSARQTVPGLRTLRAEGAWDTEVDPGSVPAGSRLIRRQDRPVGFVDGRRYVLPCASKDTDPAWLHRVYLEALGAWGLPGAAPPEEAGRIFRSDTGELVLDSTRRLFTAAAPRAAMVVGFPPKGEAVQAGRLTVSSRTGFAAVSAVSLDGEDLASARRVLVTAVARAENTGQAYLLQGGAPAPAGIDADTGSKLAQSSASLAEPGRAPVLAEPVDADVTLRLAAGDWTAWRLDPAGARAGALPARTTEAGLALAVGDAHSPWILLERP